MANWLKTSHGDAVNLDLCTVVLRVSIGDRHLVRAIFPAYDGNAEQYFDIQRCDSKEEALSFIDYITKGKPYKTQAEELAEILR